MVDPNSTKPCPVCKREKPRLAGFGRMARSSDGYRYTCKTCEKARRRSYYDSAKEAQKRKRRSNAGAHDLHCAIEKDLYQGIRYIAQARGVTHSVVVGEALRQFIIANMAEATRLTNDPSRKPRRTGAPRKSRRTA